ncbi:IclR family transcriptional regulator [Cellulomonas humilata]|uniref:IclR family transcriptional regulator n=1 Tax=Cellulomonas humilata TaxID=144055 RepID=UPI001B355E25
MPPIEDDDKSPAPAVTRAAAILTLLAEQGRPLGLTDIARTLGLAKSSTLNLCIALEQAHLVSKNELGYALGRKTVELGGAYVRGFDLIREFYRVCAESVVLQHELLQIAMLDGTSVLYLARHEGRAPLRLSATVGDRFPATVTAVGSVLLAELDPAAVRDRFQAAGSLPAWTENSVTTVDGLLAKLEATRERGYAVDDGETNAGVYGLAVLLPPKRPGSEPLALGASLMKASLSPGREELIVSELLAARDHLSSPGLIRP